MVLCEYSVTAKINMMWWYDTFILFDLWRNLLEFKW